MYVYLKFRPMNVHFFTFNIFQERCYVAWDDNGTGAVIDPGFSNSAERDELYSFINSKDLTIKAILLTHAHFDHIFGAAEAALNFNAPIYMHPADEVIISEANPLLCKTFGLETPSLQAATDSIRPIADEEEITVGDLKFKVIATPGHTPGGVCYLETSGKTLFSGDTLFAGSIGRTDNQWASYDALMDGIFNKLMELDGDITVCPGHGPDTSIATERTTNPFLMPFNEPFED